MVELKTENVRVQRGSNVGIGIIKFLKDAEFPDKVIIRFEVIENNGFVMSNNTGLVQSPTGFNHVVSQNDYENSSFHVYKDLLIKDFFQTDATPQYN